MILYNLHPAFKHIAIMLESLFQFDKKYNNTVFVLGYNDLKETVSDIKKIHTNKRIITIQLEQLFYGSRWVLKKNITFLKESDEVWDYSLENIDFLKSYFNISAKLFTLKFVPELCILPPLPINKHTIDILFYGSLNERRLKIINNIKALLPEKNIICTENLWDNEFNETIQKSKIILNLHYYETNRQEQARIFFPMCNSKCIVSEKSTINYYKNGIVESEKEKIPLICKHLLNTNEWYKYSKNSIKSLIFSNEYYKNE